jgi:uncharacterized protein YlxW (UPF0749 family)
MNPFEMVAIIVVAVMIASVLRSKYGQQRRRRGGDGDEDSVQERAETIRLREEVKDLKERLHVLERIATDRENSLARQIDELRDR